MKFKNSELHHQTEAVASVSRGVAACLPVFGGRVPPGPLEPPPLATVLPSEGVWVLARLWRHLI